MPRLGAVRAGELVRALEHAGFVRARQVGSQLRLRRGNLAVTVPIHAGDLPPVVLRSILRQAHLSEDELRDLLRG